MVNVQETGSSVILKLSTTPADLNIKLIRLRLPNWSLQSEHDILLC